MHGWLWYINTCTCTCTSTATAGEDGFTTIVTIERAIYTACCKWYYIWLSHLIPTLHLWAPSQQQTDYLEVAILTGPVQSSAWVLMRGNNTYYTCSLEIESMYIHVHGVTIHVYMYNIERSVLISVWEAFVLLTCNGAIKMLHVHVISIIGERERPWWVWWVE